MPDRNETRLPEQPLEHPLLDQMRDVVYGNSNVFYTIKILNHARTCPQCREFIRKEVEAKFNRIRYADWDKTPPEYFRMCRKFRDDVLALMGDGTEDEKGPLK
jgi:hypothetical protein